MSDIRYDQYNASMPYNARDKPQATFGNRGGAPQRYVDSQMGNMLSGRISGQQGVGMMNQMRPMSVGNSNMADRLKAQASMDNGDPAFSYNMMQNNRTPGFGSMQRNPGMVDAMDHKSLQSALSDRSMNSYSNSMNRNNYVSPNMSAMSPMIPDPMQQLNEQRALYKHTAGLLTRGDNQGQSYNYVLPTSFIFPPPSISAEHMKNFSTTLLFYIFYSMPCDILQLYAAQELYARELVYHKIKQTWYKKEKQSSNYSVVNCCEEFNLSICAFTPCNEVHKIMEVLSINELNDYIKKATS